MASAAWFTQLADELSTELNGLQVGVYASGGAPFHHLALATLWGADARPVRAEAIRGGALNTLDVLIFPGGGFKAMTGLLEPLGVEGAEQVRDWVAAGGMYLGSCAGSFLPAHVGEAYWQAHEEARALHMVNATLANSSDSIFEGLTSPGVGTLQAKISDASHWLTQGLPETFDIVHYNGPLFRLEPPSGSEHPHGILQPSRATAGFTPSEGFVGEVTGETLLDRCVRDHAFNGVEGTYGDGHVVLFGSHPEFGFDVLQLGWREAVTLLANALSFQAKKRKSSTTELADETLSSEQLQTAAGRLETIAQQFDLLRRTDAQAWLGSDAPSFLGRTAGELWLEASTRAAEVAQVTATLLTELSRQSIALPAFWLDDLPLANQDVGFMGLEQLLSLIETRLELTITQLGTVPIQLEHAYDGFDTHPYQIAVSSYLSAAGLMAAAHLLGVTIAKLSHHSELIPMQFLVHDPSQE